MQPYDLIIFDCDGVLVDSERITCTVLSAMLNELGLQATMETTYQEFVGNSLDRCITIIEEKLNHPIPTTFVPEFKQRQKEALTQSLKAVDGIKEALAQITLPTCVASSGDHEKMKTTLGVTGLLPHFEGRITSTTEVAHSKPAPDVYLLAASKMQTTPDRCAVVEDTVIGVKAAIAAGMTVYGYAKLTNPDHLAAAGAIPFDNMHNLPTLLQPKK
ncbi:MAG: HAD family hydrolase [Akkermansiaceae bacterium]